MSFWLLHEIGTAIMPSGHLTLLIVVSNRPQIGHLYVSRRPYYQRYAEASRRLLWMTSLYTRYKTIFFKTLKVDTLQLTLVVWYTVLNCKPTVTFFFNTVPPYSEQYYKHSLRYILVVCSSWTQANILHDARPQVMLFKNIAGKWCMKKIWRNSTMLFHNGYKISDLVLWSSFRFHL